MKGRALTLIKISFGRSYFPIQSAFDPGQCEKVHMIYLSADQNIVGDRMTSLPNRLYVFRYTKQLVGFVVATLLMSPAAASSQASRGEALVKANCARCHAVGHSDRSYHPEAPPFRTLSQRYPLQDLEEALAEGISTGHPDMPEFVASPDQIDAIIAYISSLAKK